MQQARSEYNTLYFTQGFVGQQIDLEQYPKPYWQPLEGTKQWKKVQREG